MTTAKNLKKGDRVICVDDNILYNQHMAFVKFGEIYTVDYADSFYLYIQEMPGRAFGRFRFLLSKDGEHSWMEEGF